MRIIECSHPRARTPYSPYHNKRPYDHLCHLYTPLYYSFRVAGSGSVGKHGDHLVIYEERKKKGLVVRYMNNEVFNPNGNSNPFFSYVIC